MTIYRCPVCEQPLTQQQKSYTCTNNHSFDIARQGYVNMLLPNQKKSSNPGDSKDMLLSRREFLHQGYYDRLSDAINTQLHDTGSNHDTPFTLLDVGCGEGFYLRRLQHYLDNYIPQHDCQLYGTDISKDGVRYAAGLHRAGSYFVASLYQLPVQDDSVNGITRIFAPKSYAEFARVLKPGGTLLSVVPGAEHLIELKRIIYETPQRHQPDDDPDRARYFTQTQQTRVTYRVTLPDTETLFQLVKMTPYYWRLSEETENELRQAAPIDITVDCLVDVFARLNAL
jgi:23S rRNA (guanine745-N1)-methyltransferase